MREDILNAYPDIGFLFADGLDDAILGVDEASWRIIYSVTRCIEIFQGHGMSADEAAEYFDFNVKCAYVGEQTPIWCDDMF